MLWEDWGEFEAKTGKIDKDLIYELVVLKIMSDSQEKTMKEFRRQVVDNPHQGFSSEFHSFTLSGRKAKSSELCAGRKSARMLSVWRLSLGS